VDSQSDDTGSKVLETVAADDGAVMAGRNAREIEPV
jgi:hypothetical protein